MSRDQEVQRYLRALSKALCARFPVDYPTILATAQDKYMQLENAGRMTHLSDYKPLLRRVIVNAVIDVSRKAKKRNERELPYALVFGGEDTANCDENMAESCGDDTYSNNPPEQCDWKDFVHTVLNKSERVFVELLTEMPEAFNFTGNCVKELRGAMHRYLKAQGMTDRKFWSVQKELKRKLSERTEVRRVYSGNS